MQYVDGEKATQLRDSLTISKSELDHFINMIDSMLRDIAIAAKATQEGATAGVQAGGQRASQPAPLSAANLEKQAQALKQAQNRVVAKPAQPPTAPTSSQPPVQFGAHKSPAGNPEYYGEQRITQANLVIPPSRKKARTGLAQTSPSMAHQQVPDAPSPPVKAPSPVVSRKPEPTQAPPILMCPEPGCETGSSGFQTEEALNAHRQEEHVKPFENPLGFLQEHMTAALGLDSQGQPKASPKPSVHDASTPAAVAMSSSLSKQGKAPMGKPEPAAPPMSRAPSMRRQGSAASGKLGENVGTPGRNAPGRAATTPQLSEGLIPPEDPWARQTVDPQNLFANLGPSLDSVAGTTILSDLSAYRSSTPNDTPESSKDSGVSEPTSDIAEGAALDIDLSWQPLDDDVLLGMSNVSLPGMDATDMFEGEALQVAMDEMANDFSKPFRFDASSMYSLDNTV